MAVVGTDAHTMIDRAESLVRDNPFLELRLDYLSQPLAAIPKLKNFLEMHPEATVDRHLSAGRQWWQIQGFGRRRAGRTAKAADSGFPLVDMELQSAEA